MSQLVQVGELLFVSGQVALDANGDLVGDGDFLTQARQCFANIERVLEPVGATLEHVVKITTYLTDLEHGPSYYGLRAELFAEVGAPASSTVIVAGLLDSRFLVEVEAIAVLGG